MAETIFSYRAFDVSGGLHTGVISAEAPGDVAERIRRLGLRPISVEKKRGGSLNRSLSIPGLEKKVKAADLGVFSRQLGTMLSSGLPMMRCFAALQQQHDHPTLLKAINAIKEDVQNGGSLPEALAKHPKVFDALYTAMIEAGDTNGNVDEVLFQLADTLERMAAVRRKVRSAMTYPIVIAGLAIMIVTAMLVFLVPTFERIFADLNGRLPLPTRIVMGASRFLTANALSVLALVVATALLLRLALRTTTGRYRWDTLKLKLPILGPILLRSSLARFSRSLGGLLRSGTMILDALQIASRTVPNAVLRRAVDTMGTEVRNGRGIAACMSEHSIFPAMVVQMVDVGEESGKLDAMLDKVAEYYEQRVQASVDAITSLIEPVLLVFMGVTVGGMVIALYLPMFEIINVVK